MNGRPLALDLFCCAGGSAVGLHRGGFDIVGVDIKWQPNFPFEFVNADALEYLVKIIDNGWRLPDGRRVHAVNASPPCQFYCALARGTNNNTEDYPALIEPTRELLAEATAAGIPWIIENVAKWALVDPIKLCGEMFGLQVIRHRWFETNYDMAQPAHPKHRGRVAGWRHGQTYEGYYYAVYGNGGQKGTLADWKRAMGISWMQTKAELVEAIPPRYLEFLGAELFKVVR